MYTHIVLNWKDEGEKEESFCKVLRACSPKDIASANRWVRDDPHFCHFSNQSAP